MVIFRLNLRLQHDPSVIFSDPVSTSPKEHRS